MKPVTDVHSVGHSRPQSRFQRLFCSAAAVCRWTWVSLKRAGTTPGHLAPSGPSRRSGSNYRVGRRDAVTSFIWRTPIDAGPSSLIIVYRESELTFICLCFEHYWSGIGWRDSALGATRVARYPVFYGSSRISAPISRLPERSYPGDDISRI